MIALLIVAVLILAYYFRDKLTAKYNEWTAKPAEAPAAQPAQQSPIVDPEQRTSSPLLMFQEEFSAAFLPMHSS